MLKVMTCLFVALSSVLCTGAAQAECDFDDFPTMVEMKLFTVMGDSTVNNRPMMVKGYTADVSMEVVQGYYAREWKGRMDTSEFGPWLQLTTVEDDCIMTVQVAAQDEDSTQGRLIIGNTPLIDSRAPLGAGVMMPSDTMVVSDMLTSDGPKRGRVTVLSSGQSASSVASFYRSAMRQQGWKLDHSSTHGDARAMVFKDGLNLRNILIVPGTEMTQVLINDEVVD